MSAFNHAARRHRVLAEARKVDRAASKELWSALTGLGREPPGSFAEAVRDTTPVEHAALLAVDEVAVANAFEALWEGALSHAGLSPFELRDLARGLWARFDVRAKRVRTLAEGFGWDLSSAWVHGRDVDLAREDSGRVERIARLAGRMYASLLSAWARRVPGLPEEVYAVEQGCDIARLLPSELVQLADPELEIVALERIASRRAAQFAVRGTTKVSKGPLVVAIDESSSMHNERNEWAKAVAVTLSRVASKEGRAFRVVHYSTSAVVQALRPNVVSVLVSMIRHFLGGGTAIGLALGVAVDQVAELARRGDRGADIILVTDGVDEDIEAQERALKAAATVGARLWTVAVECDISEASPLRRDAAGYVRVFDRGLSSGDVGFLEVSA